MSRRKTVTKWALAVSIALIVTWVILGANASLAWFRGEDEIVNSLHFGDLKVELYHKTNTGYEKVEESTEVFDGAALYEPGFTQIVYVRIDNAGTVDFSYDMSVVPILSTLMIGKNEKGGDIDLTDYLLFGLVFDETEEALLEKMADRDAARTYATRKLSDYSETGGTLSPGDSNYCALILYMPEEVANEANYRGDKIPSVYVGISAVANQIH